MPRRLTSVALMLLGLTLVGTIGFRVFEDLSYLDAAYLTIITLTTVGYGDLAPVTDEGKIFNILLIGIGVGTVAYSLSAMFDLVLSEDARKNWQNRRRRRMLDAMEDHVIICGFGQMGQSVAEHLSLENIPFVVVDPDDEAVESARDAGFPALHGSGADEEVLEHAGVSRARSLVASVDSDAESVFITLTARALREDLQIIARANQDRSKPKLERAGADRVVLPYLISGQRMVSLVSRPNVADFLDIVMHSDRLSMRMEELVVPEDSPIAGRNLAELQARERFDVTVLAMCGKNGEVTTSPNASQLIEGGSQLILLGTDEGLRGFENLAASPEA